MVQWEGFNQDIIIFMTVYVHSSMVEEIVNTADMTEIATVTQHVFPKNIDYK